MNKYIAVVEQGDVYKITQLAETCIEVTVNDDLVGIVTVGIFQSFDGVFKMLCNSGRMVYSDILPENIPNKNF